MLAIVKVFFSLLVKLEVVNFIMTLIMSWFAEETIRLTKRGIYISKDGSSALYAPGSSLLALTTARVISTYWSKSITFSVLSSIPKLVANILRAVIIISFTPVDIIIAVLWNMIPVIRNFRTPSIMALVADLIPINI